MGSLAIPVISITSMVWSSFFVRMMHIWIRVVAVVVALMSVLWVSSVGGVVGSMVRRRVMSVSRVGIHGIDWMRVHGAVRRVVRVVPWVTAMRFMMTTTMMSVSIVMRAMMRLAMRAMVSVSIVVTAVMPVMGVVVVRIVMSSTMMVGVVMMPVMSMVRVTLVMIMRRIMMLVVVTMVAVMMFSVV